MKFDLERLAALAAEREFEDVRLEDDRLLVTLREGVVLELSNLGSDDNMICLQGGEWHCHDALAGIVRAVGGSREESLSPEQVLEGLVEGSVWIAELRERGRLRERWLTRTEWIDSGDVRPAEEELRLSRAVVGVRTKRGASARQASASSPEAKGACDQLDRDKLCETALAILALTLHHDRGVARAWKGIDWGVSEELAERGWIHAPRGKAKSVVFTELGLRMAEEFRRRYFAPE